MPVRVLAVIAILSLPLGWWCAPASAWDDSPRKDAAQEVSRPKNEGRNSAANPRNNGPKVPLAITPEREAAVKTFVERNHPELVALLELLKESRPAEYERAVRELHRVTEKLAQVQERDSQLYDLELKSWQVHSRIQLLVARLKMGAGDEVREELKEAIAEQLKAREALLRHERQRVSDRLQRIEKDLQRLEGNHQELVEKQFDMLIRVHSESKKAKAAGGKSPVARKSGKKPLANPQVERPGRPEKNKSDRKP